jgi:hypothetical protein
MPKITKEERSIICIELTLEEAEILHAVVGTGTSDVLKNNKRFADYLLDRLWDDIGDAIE